MNYEDESGCQYTQEEWELRHVRQPLSSLLQRSAEIDPAKTLADYMEQPAAMCPASAVPAHQQPDPVEITQPENKAQAAPQVPSSAPRTAPGARGGRPPNTQRTAKQIATAARVARLRARRKAESVTT